MTEPIGALPKRRARGAVPLIVEELDPAQIRPGSTQRPHRRYSHGGASIVLGLAEVYQQAPLVWALARWRFEDPADGRAVLEAATAPGPVYVLFNAEGTPDWALRRELLEAARYTLDYEKMAVCWEDNGQPLPPASLTVSDAYPDLLIPLIDACQADTLDRADARWPVPGRRSLTRRGAVAGAWHRYVYVRSTD